MNYQEFLTSVHSELSARVDTDISLSIQSFTKNNGIRRDGLVLLRPGRNVSPTIYLLPYYHRYLEGVCLADICDDILLTYQANEPKENFDVTCFTDFSRIRSHIVMRLVNFEQNRALLEDVPHFLFHDLAVIFYCMLRADEEQQASILIRNCHLSLWDTTADELSLLAMQNSVRLLPPQLIPLEQMIGFSPEQPTLPLHVLTNKSHINGAAVILYDGLLAETAASFGKDLILLPSSIHEFLLLPAEKDERESFSHYDAIVREVNETQLSDEEILSDHAYYYNRADGRLEICAKP